MRQPLSIRVLECRHVTDQVEGLLFPLVIHTIYEACQSRDRCLELHVLAGAVGEELRDEERLRQESLNLTGTVHYQAVLFGEFV